MKETDLYEPVKILFESLGYTVDAEVAELDVMATLGDECIVIELKKELNLRLIVQGAKRQKLSDMVYVAVPKPSYKTRMSKVFLDKLYLLKRLGIGLIFVNFKTNGAVATIEEEPMVFDLKQAQRQNRKIREKALKEKSMRSGSYNLGGQKGTKMTAYRENVLLIAGLISKHGDMRVADIRAVAGEKTNTILQKDFYGYFTRVKRGIYGLSQAGEEAITTYSHIIEKLI